MALEEFLRHIRGSGLQPAHQAINDMALTACAGIRQIDRILDFRFERSERKAMTTVFEDELAHRDPGDETWQCQVSRVKLTW